jgi:spermidine synthase
VLETLIEAGQPIRALHLGGGLCTVPRWLAARNPKSRQRVAEHSAEIAKLAVSLGMPAGVTLTVADALAVASRARSASIDLVICDVYDGPDTVTKLYTLDAVVRVRRALRADGVYVCNLSDAAPFALSQVVAATLRQVFGSVVMLAEPPVLRGRRSGNVVLAATDRELPLPELARRAAGGVVRARVVAGSELDEFIGTAVPAARASDVPPSGESTGRALR